MSDNRRYPNVPHPALFAEQLQKTLAEISNLIQLTRESTLSSQSEDGCWLFEPDEGPNYFQAAGQFARPSEFLQSFLDMVRVMFEPNPPGTMFLNSNPGLLVDGMPADGFQLVYLSEVSEKDESIQSLHDRVITPALSALGYNFQDAIAKYIFVTAGGKRSIRLEMVRQTIGAYDAGFSPDELVPMMAATVQGGNSFGLPPGKALAGYSSDPAIEEERIRVSMWLYFPTQAVGDIPRWQTP